MITSFEFSQRFDPISILAGAVGALWSTLRTLALLLLGAVGLAATFAVVVAFWLPIVQVIGALAIVGAFAWLTYPRSKVVRP